MAELLVASLVGLGLVLVYDGLTRPARHQRPSVLPGLLLAVVCGLLAGVAAWLVTGLLVDADTGVGYVLEPDLPLEAYRSVLEGPKPQRGPLQWRDGEWQLIEQQQPPR